MVEHKPVQKTKVGKLSTAGAIGLGLALSMVPASFIGAGFAKIYNALNDSHHLDFINVVTVGALLGLTAVLYFLIQIREEIRARG